MKKLTSKKTNKTDDDLERIARLEWDGSLYYDPEAGPVLPAESILGAIVMGGRTIKLGTKIERGVVPMQSFAPLEYAGPRDLDGLWATGFRDIRRVVVGRGVGVMRCRPRFATWAAEFDLLINAAVVDEADVLHCAEVAGDQIGVCEHSFAWGRFEVKLI